MNFFKSRFLKVFVCFLLIVNIVTFSVVKRYSASVIIPTLVVVGAGAVVAYMAALNNSEFNAAAEAFGSEVSAYLDLRHIRINPTDDTTTFFAKLGASIVGFIRGENASISNVLPNSFIFDNPALSSLWYSIMTSIKDNGVDAFRNKVLALPLTNDIIKAFDEFFGYSVPEKVEVINKTIENNDFDSIVVETPVYEYVPSIAQSNINNYQSAMRNVDAFSSRFWHISTDSVTEIWNEDTSSWDTVSYDFESPVFLGSFYPNSIIFSVDSSEISLYGKYFTATVYGNEILKTDVIGDLGFGSFLPSDVLMPNIYQLPYYVCDSNVNDIFRSTTSRLYYSPPYTFGLPASRFHDAILEGNSFFRNLVQSTLENYVNIRVYVLTDLNDLGTLVNIDDWLATVEDGTPIDAQTRSDDDVVAVGLPAIDASTIDDSDQLVVPVDGINVPAVPILDTDASYYLPDLIDSLEDTTIDVGDKIIDAIHAINPAVTIPDVVPVEATTPDTGVVPPGGNIPGFPSSQLWDVWKYVEYLFGQGLAFVNFAKDSFLAFPWQARWLLYGVLVFVSLVGVFRRLLG